MATITAPPAPPANFYSAKSIRGANGVQIDIFGYPIPNSLSTDGLTVPFSFPNPATLFDVSSLTSNHEVIVVGYVSPNQIASAVTYTAIWYRNRDNEIIFQKSVNISSPPEGYVWATGTSIVFWIGWLSENPEVITYPQYKEIQENGDYHVVISASGGENFSQTINFAVKGIPAQTILSNPTKTGFDWLVRLSDFFDTSNYIRAGVCNQPFTNGQSAAPNGIVAFNNAPSSNIATVTGGTITGQSPGTTYTLYGFAQAANGLYYQAGSASITTISTRPSNWTWTTAELNAFNNHGSLTTLTYSRWNAFLDRITEFEVYKYGSALTTFNKMTSSDKTLTAARFNQARFAIGSMYSTGITNKSSGDPVLGSYFITMANSLNSIT